MLAWNYSIVCVFYYLSTYASPKELQKFQKIKVVWGITLPFAGWLADVYLGWYKVIHWSMWIMWVASMLATASSVVAQLVNITKNIALLLHIIMAIGFGGYQANVIQFGTDQLHDASTDEITSFISWYMYGLTSVVELFLTLLTNVQVKSIIFWDNFWYPLVLLLP